ncbi:hypothetical protein EYZ11_011598 [Aspergillus tanneri]|uniref:Uncharacterized protein n=1 Tax=Aspergillus tanneri TaxID=1220188 RepID=A0A4S3J4K4_9EURO|nr:hypothetical protein EYZ11_011598 [Aspergillus tanneri]
MPKARLIHRVLQSYPIAEEKRSKNLQ